ncbi:MAG TPA: glycosyltransferase, partial [Longimicrobium sp.]|nr:glycosyltransferase [Longimicrobium sp.]
RGRAGAGGGRVSAPAPAARRAAAPPLHDRPRMKVLFVCRRTPRGTAAPFNLEQAESLRRQGVEVDFFLLERPGVRGYAGALGPLRRAVRDSRCDLVHAHFGLSGMLAVLQRLRPVVTTFHGSDVGYLRTRGFSFVASRLSRHSIFVEGGMVARLGLRGGYTVLPCGIDMDTFRPRDRAACRRELGIGPEERVVLFSGRFDVPRKNAALARAAVDRVPPARLVELRGYGREAVCRLMNAADALLMTSHLEGSPQVVKEAMACNLPVVSVPVGDVPAVIAGTEGCHLAGYDAKELAARLEQVFARGGRTEGRRAAERFGLDAVAGRLVEIYRQVLHAN